MVIINAKEFADKTGYPLAMIRAYCRGNLLPHWQCGRVYLLDEDEALAVMQTLKVTKVQKKLKSSKPRIEHKPRAAGSNGEFDYRATIGKMQAENRKRS